MELIFLITLILSIGIIILFVKEIDNYFINKKVLKMKEEQLIVLICSSKQDPFLEDKVYLLWESIKLKKISDETRIAFLNFDSLPKEKLDIKLIPYDVFGLPKEEKQKLRDLLASCGEFFSAIFLNFTDSVISLYRNSDDESPVKDGKLSLSLSER